MANNITKIDKLYTKIWTTKSWYNKEQFCDRKHHPSVVYAYRVYRRGKNRCSYCGGKIGKVELIKESPRRRLIDSIYSSSPLFDLLKKKGRGCGE